MAERVALIDESLPKQAGVILIMLTFLFGGKHDENMKGRNEEGCCYQVHFEII